MSLETIESMARWVRDNITEDPSLKGMSAFVGYSPCYCSAKFSEHMGLTFKQYLSRCKIEAVEKDLLATDDKITDIAFRYGFQSLESMTRAFSAIYSCSPRAYRRCRREAPEGAP